MQRISCELNFFEMRGDNRIKLGTRQFFPVHSESLSYYYVEPIFKPQSLCFGIDTVVQRGVFFRNE